MHDIVHLSLLVIYLANVDDFTGDTVLLLLVRAVQRSTGLLVTWMT